MLFALVSLNSHWVGCGELCNCVKATVWSGFVWVAWVEVEVVEALAGLGRGVAGLLGEGRPRGMASEGVGWQEVVAEVAGGREPSGGGSEKRSEWERGWGGVDG